MSTVEKLHMLSVQEYLDAEQQGEVRHEYVDGCVYAMFGDSARHNLISSALMARLRGHLRGGLCRFH